MSAPTSIFVRARRCSSFVEHAHRVDVAAPQHDAADAQRERLVDAHARTGESAVGVRLDDRDDELRERAAHRITGRA